MEEQCKEPLLIKMQKKRRVDFAHSHWTWTLKQSKCVVQNYAPDGRRYVRRSFNQEFISRYASRLENYSEVGGCLSFNSVGPLYRITGIFNKEKYANLLKKTTCCLGLRRICLIYGNFIRTTINDPNDSAKLTKNCCTNTRSKF